MINFSDFLDNQDYRLLNILDFFTFKGNSLPVSKIQEINGCSLRTVYNDIDQLLNFYEGVLDLEFDRGVLLIKNHSFGNYYALKRKLIRNSIYISLILFIYGNPGVNVDIVANEMQVSSSYAYRMIAKLRDVLKDYGIVITTQKLKLESESENKLRILISDIIYSSCFFDSNYPNIDEREAIMSFISDGVDRGHVVTNNYLQLYLTAYINVSLAREIEGYNIVSCNNSENFSDCTNKTTLFELYEDKFPMLKHEEFNNVFLPLYELKESYLRLKNEFDLNREVSLKLFEECCGDIENKEILFLNLLLLISIHEAEIFYDISMFDRYFFHAKKIKQTNLGFYNKIHITLTQILFDYLEEKNNSVLMETMIGITAMSYTNTIYINSRKVIIISDFSRMHASSMKRYLSECYKHHNYSAYYIDEISEKDWDSNLNKAIDFVISTISIDFIPKEKQIIVDDIFDHKDLFNIYEKLYFDQLYKQM